MDFPRIARRMPDSEPMSALSFDDIAYAMEHTVVAHEPDRLIDTFGTTNFRFHLLTEPMDTVGVVRIREGRMETERPKIIRPEGYNDLLFEGFGEQAQAFAEWFRQNGLPEPEIAALQKSMILTQQGAV